MQRLNAIDLRCEHLFEPQGLNTRQPRFTWALMGEGRDRRQTAYRIIAGNDRQDVAAGRGDCWDSGKVDSNESLHIPYAGRRLRSDESIHWSVAVWDETGTLGPWSAPATFRTGLLDEADWTAKWIARALVPPGGRMPPQDTEYDNPYWVRPADYWRKAFALDRAVKRATAYVAALGLYEFRVNGEAVGDQVMAPGWTDYHTRVEYQSYDVTPQLRLGVNTLGAIVGEGWYSGRVAYDAKRAGSHYGVRPAFLCQLHLEFDDGVLARVVTDSSWRCGHGAIVYSDLLLGEKYDSRLEQPGWDVSGFDDSKWWAAEEIAPRPRSPRLDAARGVPTRRIVELPAAFLHRTESGAYIFDIGQNLAGRMRLTVDARRGETFVLRHGEALAPDGTLYTANLRWALATDIFVAGGGGQVFEPRFTVHGFRYVELSAPEGYSPANITLRAIAIHSDMPPAGTFECGNELVNRLHANIVWTQRSNFLSVPTDCPQRDERMGWLGDAQVFFETSAYNMDVSAFFAKWLVDVQDAQTPDGAFTDVAPSLVYTRFAPEPPRGAPGWGDAGVILPWRMYRRYGDADLLQSAYAGMVRWMDHVERANPGLIREGAVYSNWGDWLALGNATPKAVVATAYWVLMADIMARAALAIGRRPDAARFRTLARDLRAAFRRSFMDAELRVAGDSQTGYLFVLSFDLAETHERARVLSHLKRAIREAGGHAHVGIHGIGHLCPILAEAGEAEMAYELLLKETYPSWGFSIRNGATTIWERWDGWTPERGFQSVNMNSLNHYALGAVGEFLFARVAGIDVSGDTVACDSLRLRPLPARALGWCKASYRGHRGTIESEWRYEGDEVHWRVVLPPNWPARIETPAALSLTTIGPAGERTPLDPAGLVLSSGVHSFVLRPARH